MHQFPSQSAGERRNEDVIVHGCIDIMEATSIEFSGDCGFTKEIETI